MTEWDKDVNTDEEKLKKDINGEIQVGNLLLLSLDRFRQHAVARKTHHRSLGH